MARKTRHLYKQNTNSEQMSEIHTIGIYEQGKLINFCCLIGNIGELGFFKFVEKDDLYYTFINEKEQVLKIGEGQINKPYGFTKCNKYYFFKQKPR
jgi:hypothetical protein